MEPSRALPLRTSRLKSGQVPSRADIEEMARFLLAELAHLPPNAEPIIASVRVSGPDYPDSQFLIFRNYTPTPERPLHGDQNSAVYVSYKAELGRVMSRSPGEELIIERPAGTTRLRVDEIVTVRPPRLDSSQQEEVEVDARDATIRPPTSGIRVGSLRGFLDGRMDADNSPAIVVQRNFELPDRPFLDKAQDAVFREPLKKRLIVSGPAGGGKTTVLVRRLAQKTSKLLLLDAEPHLEAGIDLDELLAPERAWTLYCPTRMLVRYVRSALRAEGLIGLDRNVKTWEDERRQLAPRLLGGAFPEILEGKWAEDPAVLNFAPALLSDFESAFESQTPPPEFTTWARRSERTLQRVIEFYKTFRQSYGPLRPLAGKRPDGVRPMAAAEIDVVIASMLRAVRDDLKGLAESPGANREVGGGLLPVVLQAYRTFIAVDEAPDFTLAQLACIARLSNPTFDSVTLAGDMAQRARSTGTQSWGDAEAAIKLGRFEERRLTSTYRQSSRLEEIGKVASTHGGARPGHDEPAPLLIVGPLSSPAVQDLITEALKRIREAYGLSTPPIAVIAPAGRLDSVKGDLVRVVSQAGLRFSSELFDAEPRENEVVLVSIEDCKGLECEAVILVDIDRCLSEDARRFFSVAATRAKRFFCSVSSVLPPWLADLKTHFERQPSVWREMRGRFVVPPTSELSALGGRKDLETPSNGA